MATYLLLLTSTACGFELGTRASGGTRPLPGTVFASVNCRRTTSPRACATPARSTSDADRLHWFVKTETFCQPFPIVKPHLEAHREWVAAERAGGYPVVSGYRVDENGKPGGGGLMLFRAASHEEAVAFVANDPLVANECVSYQVNRWIAEVGDIALL